MSNALHRGGISPYLTQADAATAIEFYKRVFGAEEIMRQMADDGQRVLHCSLALNGGVLMLSDSFPEHGGTPAPEPGRPSSVAISLALELADEVDAIHARAVEAGSADVMSPMDAFWGARFAMFTDPFGHQWMLNAEQARPR